MKSQSLRRLGLVALPFVAMPLILLRIMPRQVAKAQQPPAQTPATLTVELTNVPEVLSLPLAPDQNRIVTAVVRGGDPTAVWAARTADSKFSMTIHTVGERRYQFNLNDADLLLALRRTGNDGQFHIFARGAGSEIVCSVPIGFLLKHNASAQYSALSGGSSAVGPWLDPRQVKELQVTLDPSIPGSTPQCVVGGKSWPMKQISDGVFSFPLSAEARQSWESAFNLSIQSGDAFHEPNASVFFAIPRSLTMVGDELSVWVAARTSGTPVPGSNRYLSLACGEINEDGASLELTRADSPKNDPRLRVGELRCFQLGDHQYAWGPTRLAFLNGAGTRARVTIWADAAAEKKIVAVLPNLMSGYRRFEMTFNGKEYDAGHAPQQLANLIKESGAASVQDVLTAIGERERKLASVCNVFINNDPAIPLSVWVTDALADIGWHVPDEFLDLN